MRACDVHRGRRLRRSFCAEQRREMMISIFSMILFSALAAPVDEPPSPKVGDDKEAAGARLQFMKRSVAKYEIRLDGEKKSNLNLVAGPVLRWNKPVSSVPDGSLFI